MATYTYQGKGEYIAGIPARDLTERDVDRLSPAQVALLGMKGSDGKPLYRKRGEAASKDTGDAKPTKD